MKKKQAIGTLNVAHLKGDTQLQGSIEIPYYDSKPSYMMTNEAPKMSGSRRR